MYIILKDSVPVALFTSLALAESFILNDLDGHNRLSIYKQEHPHKSHLHNCSWVINEGGETVTYLIQQFKENEPEFIL